jgi:hypothetical protein
MIQHIIKAIGIVAMVVVCGVLSLVLAYSTLKIWPDTPLVNLAFWAVIVLIAVLLGQTKTKGST